MRDPNKLKVTLYALSAAGNQDIRVGDLQRGRIYNIQATNAELKPIIEGLWPLNCVVQNLGTQNVYLVFESRSIQEVISSALVLPPNYQWSPFGVFPLSANAVAGGGGQTDAEFAARLPFGVTGPLTDAQLAARLPLGVDVTDEAGRLLGIISGDVNVTDRVGRLLGVVASITNPVDVSDRVGRLLGVIASITAAVDVSDRAGRLLGVVASIAAAVDVSDRAARLLGLVSDRENTIHLTGTAAVNTAVTVTLPAAGAGLFHYITHIQISKLYAVVGVLNAAGIIVTTTNLNGLAWTTQQIATPQATVFECVRYEPTKAGKSAVANTNTTVVCPAQLQTIWRVNVAYFTGT